MTMHISTMLWRRIGGIEISSHTLFKFGIRWKRMTSFKFQQLYPRDNSTTPWGRTDGMLVKRLSDRSTQHEDNPLGRRASAGTRCETSHYAILSGLLVEDFVSLGYDAEPMVNRIPMFRGSGQSSSSSVCKSKKENFLIGLNPWRWRHCAASECPVSISHTASYPRRTKSSATSLRDHKTPVTSYGSSPKILITSRSETPTVHARSGGSQDSDYEDSNLLEFDAV